MIEKEQDLLVREYDYNLRSQGLSLEMLVKYTGMKVEDIKERYADQAALNVRKQLALDEIIKAENIEASDEDIENKYNEMAEQFGMKADDVKARISKEDLGMDIKSIKAFELVKDSAKITEKSVTAEEFEKMNAPEEAEKPAKKTTAKKTTTAAKKTTTAKKAEAAEEKAAEKPAAKKTSTAKKTTEAAEKKTTTTKKTTTAKKTTAAKSETAEKKPAAKKTTTAKKTTAKKADEE